MLSFGLCLRVLSLADDPLTTNSNAGMFIWIDLRPYILGSSDPSALSRSRPDSGIFGKRESVIDRICMKHKVSIAQGSIFETEEWGWFRLTFTLPREVLILGIERLMKALDEVKKTGWDESKKDRPRL